MPIAHSSAIPRQQPSGGRDRASALKKIGILTFHRCVNYGAFWQVRCLSDFFLREGYEPQVLDYGGREFLLSEIRHALRPFRGAPKTDVLRFTAKTLKCYRAQQSIRRTPGFSMRNPPDFSDFDLIVVGSDEVWNLSHPWLGKVPLFFGEKLAPKRLVSYAASFGNYPAAEGLPTQWIERLRRFDRISVRDHNSRELIERYVGVSPTLVLDPCLLAPTLGDAIPVRVRQEAPYVLVYGNRFEPELVKATREHAKSRGLQVISVGYRNDWTDRSILTAGPHDFVRLVNNAEGVVTTYFHGCVFSLRCERPFVAQLSKYRANKVAGLLSAVKATHRIHDASHHEQVDTLLSTPVEPSVLAAITELRETSTRYLQTCLES
jgi:hypothetical protein